MPPPEVLNDSSFPCRVVQRQRPTLVLFTAQGCRPCSLLTRRLPALARNLGDRIGVACCPVDASPSTARRYNVGRVPTLLLFVAGRPIASRRWLLPIPTLRRWIARILRRCAEVGIGDEAEAS